MGAGAGLSEVHWVKVFCEADGVLQGGEEDSEADKGESDG